MLIKNFFAWRFSGFLPSMEDKRTARELFAKEHITGYRRMIDARWRQTPRSLQKSERGGYQGHGLGILGALPVH